MGRHAKILSAASVLLACLSVTETLAAEPSLIGTWRDWRAFTIDKPDGRQCYTVTQPVASEGRRGGKDDVFLLVTHRPDQDVSSEVSVMTDRMIGEGRDVALLIDDVSHNLFSQGENAWARSEIEDEIIGKRLRKGRTASVVFVAESGDKITDTYSLSGSFNALAAIDEACR